MSLYLSHIDRVHFSVLRASLCILLYTYTKHICICTAAYTEGGGWLGYWGKHMRSQAFRAVREHQKVNHFPGSFEIGRKDRLWRNLARLQGRVGKKVWRLTLLALWLLLLCVLLYIFVSALLRT